MKIGTQIVCGNMSFNQRFALLVCLIFGWSYGCEIEFTPTQKKALAALALNDEI